METLLSQIITVAKRCYTFAPVRQAASGGKPRQYFKKEAKRENTKSGKVPQQLTGD